MSNLIKIEGKQRLRNELVGTPEGRFYLAILNQALTDILDRADFHLRREALEWILREYNPLRDLCLLLAERNKDYIIRGIMNKVGIKHYYELAGVIHGYKQPRT